MFKKQRQKGLKAMAIKNACESQGYTFLYVNWKKNNVHLLTPNKVRAVTSVYAFGF